MLVTERVDELDARSPGRAVELRREESRADFRIAFARRSSRTFFSSSTTRAMSALPAVGRGGVLGMAAQIRGLTYDMTELHRFAATEYAAVTRTIRDRENPGEVFNRLAAMGLITLHGDEEQACDHITEHAAEGGAITVASNDVPDFHSGRSPATVVPYGAAAGTEPVSILVVLAATPEVAAPVSTSVSTLRSGPTEFARPAGR